MLASKARCMVFWSMVALRHDSLLEPASKGLVVIAIWTACSALGSKVEIDGRF